MMRIFLLLLLIWSCGETPKKGNSINQYIDNVLYGNPVQIEISNNEKKLIDRDCGALIEKFFSKKTLNYQNALNAK